MQVHEVDVRDDGGAVRQVLHQPLPREADERLADRRARHAEPLGELDLVDRAARWQREVDDLVPQEFIDDPDAGAALARRLGIAFAFRIHAPLSCHSLNILSTERVKRSLRTFQPPRARSAPPGGFAFRATPASAESGQRGSTLPGLRIPPGSSAALIARIAAISVGLRE